MTHYDDVILPDTIALASTSGPSTSVEQVSLASGFRETNLRWTQKLRQLNIGFPARIPTAAYIILQIFEAINGPFHSFLSKDRNDWNTTAGNMENGGEASITKDDQVLENTSDLTVLGDGVTTEFQCVKDYSHGATATSRRTIQKPQNGAGDFAIKVALDGTLKTEGVDYTVDYSTGIIAFASAPGVGVAPTWGGAFYIPVAFISDDFLATLLQPGITAIPDIPLIEVRLAVGNSSVNKFTPTATITITTTAPIVASVSINKDVPSGNLTITTTAPTVT